MRKTSRSTERSSQALYLLFPFSFSAFSLLGGYGRALWLRSSLLSPQRVRDIAHSRARSPISCSLHLGSPGGNRGLHPKQNEVDADYFSVQSWLLLICCLSGQPVFCTAKPLLRMSVFLALAAGLLRRSKLSALPVERTFIELAAVHTAIYIVALSQSADERTCVLIENAYRRRGHTAAAQSHSES